MTQPINSNGKCGNIFMVSHLYACGGQWEVNVTMYMCMGEYECVCMYVCIKYQKPVVVVVVVE